MSLIYLTVGYLVFLRAVVAFVFKLPTDDERFTGAFGCYCFFILEGGSTCPEPNALGFFDMLMFLLSY